MHLVSYSASLTVLLAVSTVFGAPAQLDKTTLAQNGRDAQVLNLEFTALKASDDCTTGQIACIGDAVAQCVNSKWKLTDCLKGQSCFALPSIKDDGVNIQCTSEATAKSIIRASGVDGDIVSNDKDAKPVAFPSSDIKEDGSDEEKDDDKNRGRKVTVTVTSTITASPSVSSISSTQTLSPQDAARLLSSLSASAPKTISAPGAPGATPTSASPSSSASEPPVIQLTPAAESASATSSASSSTATATPSAGALAIASPADGPSSPY
jgi:hypothetical protein